VAIGLDLGDEHSQVCVLDVDGEVLEEGRVRTTSEDLKRWFGRVERTRVALEVGTHSPWVSRLLDECGHEVIVANARMVRLISESGKKTDKVDAETLARLARFDPKLLHPIRHRTAEAQRCLGALRARDALVRTRTLLVNHVRGAVKSYGGRLKGSSAGSFHKKAVEDMPEHLRHILLPVVECIGEVTKRIREYDKAIEGPLCEKLPETGALRQVKGVGPLTAAAFVLVIQDPQRFERSRDVGPFLGLTPRSDKSAQYAPELRITKAGDGFLRRLLVGSAHYILGPFGEDSDLRRHGIAIAQQGRKNAKKRAVVAVARKLAVLLHRLWVTGEVYEPLRNTKRKEKGERRRGGTTVGSTPKES